MTLEENHKAITVLKGIEAIVLEIEVELTEMYRFVDVEVSCSHTV